MSAPPIDPAVLAALANVLPKQAKKGRGALAPGDYDLDTEVTLAIKGSVKVSEDEEYVPTIKLPHKLALALFIKYAGVTGEAATKALTAAMTKALEIEKLEGKAKKNAIEAIREVADLDRAEARLDTALFELPKAERVGKVNVRAAVEVVAAGAAVVSEAPEAEAVAEDAG